jgi:predicted transcriptional regulator
MAESLHMLGDLERGIMGVVWAHPRVTVRQVVENLRPSRRPAYTTVMTVMNRLVEKGILRRKPDGQIFQYSASKSKCEFLAQCSRDVVNTFVKCYGDVAIAQFMDAIEDVDPKKIAALHKKLHRTTEHPTQHAK